MLRSPPPSLPAMLAAAFDKSGAHARNPRFIPAPACGSSTYDIRTEGGYVKISNFYGQKVLRDKGEGVQKNQTFCRGHKWMTPPLPGWIPHGAFLPWLCTTDAQQPTAICGANEGGAAVHEMKRITEACNTE